MIFFAGLQVADETTGIERVEEPMKAGAGELSAIAAQPARSGKIRGMSTQKDKLFVVIGNL